MLIKKGIAKTTLLILVVVIVAIAAVGGYLAYQYTRPTKQTFKIFFYDPEPGNPWWDLLAAGVEKGVQDLKSKEGIEIEFQRFDATTLDEQIRQLDQAKALRPHAIVIGARGVGVIEKLKELRREGIIVIDVDRQLPDPDCRDLALGTDNRAAAAEMLRRFLAYLEQKGVPKPYKFVIIKALPGIPVTDYRYEGYMMVLDPLIKKGEVQILDTIEVDSGKIEECRRGAEAAVTKWGRQMTAIITVNNLISIASVEALKAAGINPKTEVLVLSFDAQPESFLEMIRSGDVAWSITQTPHLEGYWGVWAAYYIWKGKITPPRGAVIHTPTYIVLPCNATWVKDFVDHIILDPTLIIDLVGRMTKENPRIYAPALNPKNC
ncbi:substrate-binding domain-containing protein [Ignisphaera sp. 4213-co]|uniref:Substrate-binding domain-containing protein n=1 Tax=Ignisphaera cupida TaxID=3050454 RepID=A0ABD4Z914_9CREN|nr:substrate-binding domain-containing protein [Ignisphaera sp. 4213-co]MDK6029058.1 substrate-binding domain-containing protein [Ignisphaera sp. 4213-co]